MLEGKRSCLAFLPIKNFLDETVAYIFSVEPDNKTRDQLASFITSFTALNLLLVMLITFSIYYLKSQKKIEAMAIYDYLTRTYSRAVLFSKIEFEFTRYQRYKNRFH
ncbi:MAG: hypothetical protein JW874_10550 [Spirochaetales bacterium]|nr:hypothetical protein [Spirochaetales bacterium]